MSGEGQLKVGRRGNTLAGTGWAKQSGVGGERERLGVWVEIGTRTVSLGGETKAVWARDCMVESETDKSFPGELVGLSAMTLPQ